MDRWRCKTGCGRDFQPASTELQDLCNKISELLKPTQDALRAQM